MSQSRRENPAKLLLPIGALPAAGSGKIGKAKRTEALGDRQIGVCPDSAVSRMPALV